MFKCIITFLALVLCALFTTVQSVGAETILLAPTLSPSDFACNAVMEIPQIECEALVALYNSTDGATWGAGDWLMDSNPCLWAGVTCSSEPGFVVRLELSDNQLAGTIPPALENLSELQELSLSINQLTGTIPSALGNLSSLTSLNLSSNQLKGGLPSALETLSNLQELFLSSNQLTGTIPSTLGTLSNLQELSLSNNQLTGTIPSALGDLSTLQRLSLSSNQLTGIIPSQFGNLDSLTSLNLSNNQLKGGIPLALGTLSTLERLTLSSNQLTGTIPSALETLSNLQWLYLDSNQLTGGIPSALAYVAQTPRLFRDSLLDNILLGLPHAQAALDRAIHTAVMEPDIAQLEDGLATRIGPRGVKLSGGQQQRVGVARMLIREPELLVFDDLSSALDVETEALLWNRLLVRKREKTILAVSHRPLTLNYADQIIVLKEGRITRTDPDLSELY